MGHSVVAIDVWIWATYGGIVPMILNAWAAMDGVIMLSIVLLRGNVITVTSLGIKSLIVTKSATADALIPDIITPSVH